MPCENCKIATTLWGAKLCTVCSTQARITEAEVERSTLHTCQKILREVAEFFKKNGVDAPKGLVERVQMYGAGAPSFPPGFFHCDVEGCCVPYKEDSPEAILRRGVIHSGFLHMGHEPMCPIAPGAKIVDGKTLMGGSKDLDECTCWVADGLRVLGYKNLSEALDDKPEEP